VIDVLVVGGGPAGLATAINCALAGLSVNVAEPRTGPIDKACGEGLMPSAVTRLAAIGVRPDGHPLRGIRYLDSRHRADAPFRRGPGLGVRRTTLHAALAARAAELAIPVLPVRVAGFTQHNSGVLVYVLEAEHAIEIVADRGIAARVDQQEWQRICDHMRERFAAREYERGAIDGVNAVSDVLARHFPDDGSASRNELADAPVVL